MKILNDGQMKYFVAPEESDPVQLTVTDNIEGFGLGLWARLGGKETPILIIEAKTPLQAANEYLSLNPHIFGPGHWIVERVVVNLADTYAEYTFSGKHGWRLVE